MSNSVPLKKIIALTLHVLLGAASLSAQSGRRPDTQPTPVPAADNAAPNTTPATVGDNDTVRVVTEEVRIPLFVLDTQGRPEHFLETDDVMVFEDDVMQQVRSIRRFPAYVAMLLDTNGAMNPAMRTSSTRDIALALLQGLPHDDYVSVLQSGRNIELVQNWTKDVPQAERALRTKLIGGSAAHFSEALLRAAQLFTETPNGNRHLVIVTDGAETPGSKVRYEDAAHRLNEAGITVHIISYAALGTDELAQRIAGTKILGPPRATAGTTARQADPTLPGIPDNQMGRVTIDLDRELGRRRRAYIAEMQRGAQRLGTLAQETGGKVWELANNTPFTAAANELARDIGAQYVVTYRPSRPLALARAGEYRRLRVALRRPEVIVRTRRGYVAAPAKL